MRFIVVFCICRCHNCSQVFSRIHHVITLRDRCEPNLRRKLTWNFSVRLFPLVREAAFLLRSRLHCNGSRKFLLLILSSLARSLHPSSFSRLICTRSLLLAKCASFSMSSAIRTIASWALYVWIESGEEHGGWGWQPGRRTVRKHLSAAGRSFFLVQFFPALDNLLLNANQRMEFCWANDWSIVDAFWSSTHCLLSGWIANLPTGRGEPLEKLPFLPSFTHVLYSLTQLYFKTTFLSKWN